MAGMRRTRRVILNGMTILSLLLALSMVAAWGLSYLRYDIIVFNFRGWVAVHSSRGRAHFNVGQIDGTVLVPRWEHQSHPPVDISRQEHALLGISWDYTLYPNFPIWRTDDIIIPHAY